MHELSIEQYQHKNTTLFLIYDKHSFLLTQKDPSLNEGYESQQMRLTLPEGNVNLVHLLHQANKEILRELADDTTGNVDLEWFVALYQRGQIRKRIHELGYSKIDQYESCRDLKQPKKQELSLVQS